MRWISVVLSWPFIIAPALAEETTLAHGKRLIENNCARCHAVAETGPSPFADAPPFREVAKNYTNEELVDGFLEGLAVRHPAMPDWEMSADQAEAIAIYVMGLLRPSAAKTTGSPAIEGHAILAKNCGRCHAIASEGTSPRKEAPPFREVVRRYPPAAIEEALAEGIVTGHNDMPVFAFEPAEIAAIIAYLDTLGASP